MWDICHHASDPPSTHILICVLVENSLITNVYPFFYYQNPFKSLILGNVNPGLNIRSGIFNRGLLTWMNTRVVGFSRISEYTHSSYIVTIAQMIPWCIWYIQISVMILWYTWYIQKTGTTVQNLSSLGWTFNKIPHFYAPFWESLSDKWY